MNYASRPCQWWITRIIKYVTSDIYLLSMGNCELSLSATLLHRAWNVADQSCSSFGYPSLTMKERKFEVAQKQACWLIFFNDIRFGKECLCTMIHVACSAFSFFFSQARYRYPKEESVSSPWSVRYTIKPGSTPQCKNIFLWVWDVAQHQGQFTLWNWHFNTTLPQFMLLPVKQNHRLVFLLWIAAFASTVKKQDQSLYHFATLQ